MKNKPLDINRDYKIVGLLNGLSVVEMEKLDEDARKRLGCSITDYKYYKKKRNTSITTVGFYWVLLIMVEWFVIGLMVGLYQV